MQITFNNYNSLVTGILVNIFTKKYNILLILLVMDIPELEKMLYR